MEYLIDLKNDSGFCNYQERGKKWKIQTENIF